MHHYQLNTCYRPSKGAGAGDFHGAWARAGGIGVGSGAVARRLQACRTRDQAIGASKHARRTAS